MKKNLITFALFIFCIGLALISLVNQPSAEINQNPPTEPIPDKQFIIGAFHDGGVPSDPLWENDYSKYSELNFNTWHSYTAPTGWGWRYDVRDYLSPLNPSTNYEPVVHGVLDDNQNIMRTFMDRPVLQYLVGGQRIDYKCESVGNDYEADHYWFYAYNQSLIETHNTNYSVTDVSDNINGTNEIVKYCNKLDNSIIDNDILINSGLRANREMSFNAVNSWMKDSTYEWYVMPKIKIDQDYANDPAHNGDVVCKIVVYGWDGITIQEEYNLTVRNFKQQDNSTYDGSYMEGFYLNQQTFIDYLPIEQSKLRNFTDTNPDHFIFDWENLTSGCDIKIYWTGVCDMWIDRVRIENEPAQNFMTLTDTDWWHLELINKLNQEIDWAKETNSIPNYFYFEECVFSHFPAIRELNNRIRNNPNHQNENEMVIWLNYELFNVHVPHFEVNWFGADKLYQYLHNDFGLNTIVMGSYALHGFDNANNETRVSYHPTTLSTSGYNVNANIFSYPESPSIYDTKLQLQLDNPTPAGTNLIYIYMN